MVRVALSPDCWGPLLYGDPASAVDLQDGHVHLAVLGFAWCEEGPEPAEIQKLPVAEKLGRGRVARRWPDDVHTIDAFYDWASWTFWVKVKSQAFPEVVAGEEMPRVSVVYRNMEDGGSLEQSERPIRFDAVIKADKPDVDHEGDAQETPS